MIYEYILTSEIPNVLDAKIRGFQQKKLLIFIALLNTSEIFLTNAIKVCHFFLVFSRETFFIRVRTLTF